MFFIGVLAIVGSVFAFKRKRWWLALTGSVLALIPIALFTYFEWSTFDPEYFFAWHAFLKFAVVPAIVAVILTVLSRKQFKGKLAEK